MRSITIDNDTRELTRLMSFTEELAKEYRLSHEEVMQLQLALEEVVVNIISYAYSPDAHELIYIYLPRGIRSILRYVSEIMV